MDKDRQDRISLMCENRTNLDFYNKIAEIRTNFRNILLNDKTILNSFKRELKSQFDLYSIDVFSSLVQISMYMTENSPHDDTIVYNGINMAIMNVITNTGNTRILESDLRYVSTIYNVTRMGNVITLTI